MQKPKAVSGIQLKVSDLKRSIDFYKKLGFEFKTLSESNAICYLNWYWIELIPTSAELDNSNIQIFMSVEDSHQTYKDIVAEGMSPVSEPAKTDTNIQFTLLDPDGYQLVFFKRK